MTTTSELDLSFIPFEAHQLEKWVKDGKSELGWRGDPRLELRIGVLSAAQNGNDKNGRFRTVGERLAWRYEIWRHNEDGTDTSILHRPADKFIEIIPELVKLDPRTPGHVDTMTRVEQANAKVDKQKSDDFKEAHGEMTEHLWKLVSDRQNGPSTFRQMPGRNPDRQL